MAAMTSSNRTVASFTVLAWLLTGLVITTSSSNAQTVLDYAGQCELPDLLDRRTAHQRFRNQRRINREPSEPYGHSNCSRI